MTWERILLLYEVSHQTGGEQENHHRRRSRHMLIKMRLAPEKKRNRCTDYSIILVIHEMFKQSESPVTTNIIFKVFGPMRTSLVLSNTSSASFIYRPFLSYLSVQASQDGLVEYSFDVTLLSRYGFPHDGSLIKI